MEKYPMTREAITAETQNEILNALRRTACEYRAKSERLYKQAEDMDNETEFRTTATEALFDNSEICGEVADAIEDLIVFLRTFRG